LGTEVPLSAEGRIEFRQPAVEQVHGEEVFLGKEGLLVEIDWTGRDFNKL
jgi:hypothetical protein